MIMCPNLSTNHDGTIATWMKPHQQGGQVKLECIYLSPFTDYNIVWFHWWGWGGMLMNLNFPHSCLRDGFLQRALLTLAFLPPKRQDRWTEKNTCNDSECQLSPNSFVPGMPRPLDVHGRWEYPEAMNFPAPKECANDFKRLKWGSCNEQRSPFFPCLCVRAGKQLETQLTHHNSKTSLEIQQIQKDFLRLCDE